MKNYCCRAIRPTKYNDCEPQRRAAASCHDLMLFKYKDKPPICGSHSEDDWDPTSCPFLPKGTCRCIPSLTVLPDETFFDLNIFKTKDKAISFRGLPPTTIEGRVIELADSYKYLLLMEDHASRSTRDNLSRHYRTIFLQRTATTDGRW